MPFTFSHPAAILPLAFLPKRWISMTGLVAGSLAPDFEYFLRMKVYSTYSHTWAGLFWFDLPLALLLAFLFHLVVRNSLIDSSPGFLFKRLHIFKNFHWTKYFKANLLVVIVSILLGITTHLLWDGFTHKDGQFVMAIEGLRKTFVIGGYTIPGYKLVQHISSLVGGVLVIYALLKFPEIKPFETQKPGFRFWFLVSSITLLVIAIRLLSGLDYNEYGSVFVTAIAGGLIGLILVSKFKTA
jgi:hypothetical protein